MARAPRMYLACYDICDAKRLRRVYQVMRGYGERLQYSVFRCVLSDMQRVQLIADLEEVIKHDEDQVLFVPLGPIGPAGKDWFTVGLPHAPPERVVTVL